MLGILRCAKLFLISQCSLQLLRWQFSTIQWTWKPQNWLFQMKLHQPGLIEDGLGMQNFSVSTNFSRSWGFCDKIASLVKSIPLVDQNPFWQIFLAFPFALLLSILIFMDHQITAVIVNRRENKLKKGYGYHLDLLVVSIALIVCTVCGLPWFVGATVLSITHVNSLKQRFVIPITYTYDMLHIIWNICNVSYRRFSDLDSTAPGEKPEFCGVAEQRITGVLIFLMIGLSVFFTPILRLIPMPVLYGVFLYMGFSSLKGNQLVDRLLLFFMPQKHQPSKYTSMVRHIFEFPLWRLKCI